MSRQIPNRTLLLIGVGYALVVIGIVAAMFYSRSSVLANVTSPEAQQEWNDWRTEAAKQDGTHGPVQRSTPRSGEPPALVLMRDYFAGSTIGLLLPVSALYGFFAWVICGLIYQSPTPAREDER
jgi:hypothetical protein